MEIEYLVAVGIFVLVFSFVVMFVSGNVLDQKEEVSTKIADVNSELVMKKLYSDGELHLISPAYRLYIYAENKNSTVDELIQINLGDYGGGDVNSVYVLDDHGISYPTVSAGQVVAFASQIESGTTKKFIFYFDDDSNFPLVNKVVSGNDTFQETVYGPEKIWLIQNKLISKIKQRNYTDNDTFQIVVENFDGSKILEYGILPDRKNIVIKKKPVIIQTKNASFVKGWLRIASW